LSRVTLKFDKADTFWRRFWGWMGRKAVDAEEGLLLENTRAVHTCWMAFPIDLIYLDANMRICKMVKSMKPWRFSMSLKGIVVLELFAGRINQLNLNLGDQMITKGEREAVFKTAQSLLRINHDV